MRKIEFIISKRFEASKPNQKPLNQIIYDYKVLYDDIAIAMTSSLPLHSSIMQQAARFIVHQNEEKKNRKWNCLFILLQLGFNAW